MLLNENGPVIACPITYNYVEMAFNFIENLKKFNLEKNIFFQCLDKDIYNEVKDHVYCELKTDIVKKIVNRGDWIEAEKFSKIPLFNYIFKKFKRDIFLSDIDVIYLKNPLPLYYKYLDIYDIVSSNDKPYFCFNRERKKDRIITCVPFKKDYGLTDQKKYGFMNGAVALYKYSEKIISSFDRIFDINVINKYPKRIEAGAAQTIYNYEIKHSGLLVKQISVFEVANGSLLNVPYLKSKVLKNATAIHYNFCSSDPYEGYRQKIEKMKENGHWIIN